MSDILDTLPYIRARWQRPGRRVPISLVVIHATQGSEMPHAARGVAHYFSGLDRPASAHVVVDPEDAIRCVLDTDTAYGAAGVNDRALHLELCGRSEQSSAQWRDEYSREILATGAKIVAAWLTRYAIGHGWLGVDDVKAGRSGITTHAIVDLAMPSTGHWDPGPAFPVAEFMRLIEEEMDVVSDAQIKVIALKSAEATHAVLEPEIRRIVHDELGKTFGALDKAGKFRRFRLIRLLRRHVLR